MTGLCSQRLIATASAFVGLGEHATDHVAGGLIDRLRHNGANGDVPMPRALANSCIHCRLCASASRRITASGNGRSPRIRSSFVDQWQSDAAARWGGESL